LQSLSVHDDELRGDIKVSLQFSLDDQSVNDLQKLGLLQFKKIRQALYAKRLVGTSGTTEEGLQSGFFYSQNESGTELLIMELVHLVNHLDRKYVIKSLLPVGLV